MLAAVATWGIVRAANEGPVCPTPAPLWGDAERTAMREAFIDSGRGYAEDAFTRTAAALDRYGASWTAMHQDTCEATHVRQEQSTRALDLRMSCLARRRGEHEALVRLLVKQPEPAMPGRAV